MTYLRVHAGRVRHVADVGWDSGLAKTKRLTRCNAFFWREDLAETDEPLPVCGGCERAASRFEVSA